MISFAGIILMVLGVASGLILLLAPFGIGPAIPGIATWILFPAFTLVGYVLFVGRGANDVGRRRVARRRRGIARRWRWSPPSPCLPSAMASLRPRWRRFRSGTSWRWERSWAQPDWRSDARGRSSV